MTDPSHRKIPPDCPSDELVCCSQKKKKKINPKLPDSTDTNMTEKEIDPNGLGEPASMEQDPSSDERSNDTQRTPLSYKESLMGFNGVENNGGNLEDEELMSDIAEKEWAMPEPTEEILNLMKTHPVVPITAEEYSEWCRPWNTALIITVLGRKINVYTLKIT